MWRCLLMPHLKAGNSEAASVVCWSNNRNKVGAVRYVLVIELHCNLVITWRQGNKNVTQGVKETSVNNHQGQLCVFSLPGSWAMYETPQVPSLRSSKEISALLGPSTAMARPPAPASLVQILNSAGKRVDIRKLMYYHIRHVRCVMSYKASSSCWNL